MSSLGDLPDYEEGEVMPRPTVAASKWPGNFAERPSRFIRYDAKDPRSDTMLAKKELWLQQKQKEEERKIREDQRVKLLRLEGRLEHDETHMQRVNEISRNQLMERHRDEMLRMQADHEGQLARLKHQRLSQSGEQALYVQQHRDVDTTRVRHARDFEDLIRQYAILKDEQTKSAKRERESMLRQHDAELYDMRKRHVRETLPTDEELMALRRDSHSEPRAPHTTQRSNSDSKTSNSITQQYSNSSTHHHTGMDSGMELVPTHAHEPPPPPVVSEVQPPPPPPSPPPKPPAPPTIPKLTRKGTWGSKLLHESYKIVSKIGEGMYGSVYKAHCVDTAAGVVALKKIRTRVGNEGFPLTSVREIKLLRMINHPNVVRLLDIVAAPQNNDIMMVLEYVQHDLAGLMDSVIFDEDQAWYIMFQLLEGLDYCHKMKIMHRDLKASNLLLTPTGHLKIADFGLGKEIKDDKEHLYTNNVVTIWYRPPELLLGQESYGPEIDMWSAGCIFGELLIGKPVFQGKGDQVTMEINQLDVIARVCGTPTSSNWPKCVLLPFFGRLNSNYPRRVKEHFEKLSKSVVDMLDQLLKLDPEERWTAEKALELPYLVELNRKFLREGPPEFGNTLPRDSSHEWEVKDRRRELRKLNATHTQPNASSQHMPGSMGSYTNSASATTNHSNTNNTTHGSINSHNSGSVNRTDGFGSPSGLAQESPSLLPLVDSGGRPNSAKRLRGTQSESLSRASARIRDSSNGTKGPVSGAPSVDTARAGSTEPLKCTRTDTEGYGDTRHMGSGGGSRDRVKQVAGRTKPGGVGGNVGQDIHARTGKRVHSLTGGTGSEVDPSSVQARMDAPSLWGRTESVRERRGSRGPFDPRGETGVSISKSNNKSNSNRHIDNISNTSRDTAAWHDELDSMLDDTTQTNAKDMKSLAIKPVQRNINGQADTARKTVTAPATFSVGVSVGGSERRINGLPMSLSGRLGNLSAKGSVGGPAMDTGTASINRFAGVVKRLGPAGKNITQSIDRMERERQKREKGKGKKKRKRRVRYSSSSSGESFGRSRSRSYSRSRSRSRDRSPRYAHTHRGGPSGSRYRERDRDSLSRERDRDSYGVKQRYRERDISPPMHRRRHRGHSIEGMYGSPNPSLRPYQHEPPIRHPAPYMGTHVLPPGMAARRGFGGEPRYAEERGRSSARESRTKPYGRRKR